MQLTAIIPFQKKDIRNEAIVCYCRVAFLYQCFLHLSQCLYVFGNTDNCYDKNLEEIPSGIPATTQNL